MLSHMYVIMDFIVQSQVKQLNGSHWPVLCAEEQLSQWTVQ